MKTALFTSNLTGEYLLDALDSLGVYPQVYTYPHGFQKTALARDFTKYRGMFPITFISSNKYADAADIRLDEDTAALCVDWTKDFFMESSVRAVFAHPSLLPLYRGYSAVTEQFLRGVAISGASFYEASERVDGGDILYSEEIKIGFGEYPEDFLKKYAAVSARFVKDFIEKGFEGFRAVPQDEREAFYLPRKRRKEGVIDFNRDAYSIYNHIRGFSRPYFGAYFMKNGQQVTVWRASTEKWQGEYGRPGGLVELTPYGAEIACGSGTIVIEEAEYEGRLFRRGEVHELYYAVD